MKKLILLLFLFPLNFIKSEIPQLIRISNNAGEIVKFSWKRPGQVEQTIDLEPFKPQYLPDIFDSYYFKINGRETVVYESPDFGFCQIKQPNLYRPKDVQGLEITTTTEKRNPDTDWKTTYVTKQFIKELVIAKNKKGSLYVGAPTIKSGATPINMEFDYSAILKEEE